MELSNPILICDPNEDFRSLLRDMLTKHGFFHVVEVSSAQEGIDYIKQNTNAPLSIIRDHFLSNEFIQLINKNKPFVVIAQDHNPKTTLLAARLGVKHFLSFPFSSQKLIEKIQIVL